MENEKPLSMFLTTDISFLRQLELLLAINNLYSSLGGDGLLVSETECLEGITEAESEYDIHKGTEFENKTTRLRPSIITLHIGRQEVYNAIRFLAKDGKDREIIESLDKKFPRKIWEDKFPKLDSLAYLFNKYSSSFDLEGKI